MPVVLSPYGMSGFGLKIDEEVVPASRFLTWLWLGVLMVFDEMLFSYPHILYLLWAWH